MVFIMKAGWLMLFREIINVYSENHKKLKYNLCGSAVEFLKADGKYCSHCAFKMLQRVPGLCYEVTTQYAHAFKLSSISQPSTAGNQKNHSMMCWIWASQKEMIWTRSFRSHKSQRSWGTWRIQICYTVQNTRSMVRATLISRSEAVVNVGNTGVLMW